MYSDCRNIPSCRTSGSLNPILSIVNEMTTLCVSVKAVRQWSYTENCRPGFRSAKPEAGETPSQFLTRIDNYLERWIELAKVTKSYEGLKTLIVQEQYLSTCPKEMAMHLKEGKPKTIIELGEVAENYIEAHATDIVFGFDPRLPKIRSLQYDTPSLS